MKDSSSEQGGKLYGFFVERRASGLLGTSDYKVVDMVSTILSAISNRLCGIDSRSVQNIFKGNAGLTTQDS